MKHGRPTLNDQKKIKEIIFSYYKNGIEAFTVHRITGINYKTILKYYSYWNKEMFASEKNDFLTRLKITKERNILMIDDVIISLVKEQKKIESQLENALQIGNVLLYEKLYRLKLKLTDQLMKVVSSKTNLIGTPTADIIIQQERQDV
jgi:hypothetical protein